MVLHALTKTGKWILYLLAALIVLLALLVASIRLAVFYSEDYSEELASLVSNYVGSPVEIGNVDLVWHRFDASASLTDVQIRSADGASTLLELPQLELQLNVRDMLLERNLSVRSVQLSNLSLAASYAGRGKLRMLGKDQSAINTDKPAVKSDNQNPDSAEEKSTNPGLGVLSWLFNAERIAILDSDITLIDEERDRKYEIDKVNIRAFNDGDRHQIRVNTGLPGEIGANSTASFDFTGSADDISAWQGQFYIDTKRLNVGQLSDLWRRSTESYSGSADVQVWGDWSGTRVNRVRAIASASDLSVRQPLSSSVSDAAVVVDTADVDLNWVRTGTGWQMNFARLAAVVDGSASAPNNQLILDGLDMHVERNAAGDKALRASGPDINLQALQQVVAFVDAIRTDESQYPLHLLRSGEINNWLIGGVWQANGFKLTDLTADAANLVLEPFDKQPGISGLSASVFYREGTGQLSIDNQDVNLSLPALYDNPLPVINVDGQVKFLVANNLSLSDSSKNSETALSSETLWKVVSEDLRLSSLDLNTSATFSFEANTDGGRLLDLHTDILNANLSHLKDYLPTRVIKPKLLGWLQTSMQAGDIVRGRVELKGDLTNFAPANGVGHFYAESDVVDTRFKFHPKWPVIEEMDGNVSITASAMRGRIYQGRMREAKFSDARLYLPDFKRPIVELQTNAIGPLADMLDFAQTGPLAKNIGSFFGDASGDGVSRVAFDVKVPLKKELRDELVVDGELLLDNAQIKARQFGIELESATGKVGFSRSGLAIDDLQVRYQGVPIEVKATRLPGSEDINRLSVNGPMSIASVMKSYGIPLVEPFDGISDWNVNVDIKRRPGKKPAVKLTASSDLSGTRIELPVPLNKAANTLREMRVSHEFSAAEKDWWVEMPGLAKARFRIANKKLESMAVAFGSSNNNVLPWRGIALHGDVQQLDVQGWVKFALGFQSKREADTAAFPLFAKINARQMLLGSERSTVSADGSVEGLGGLVYIAYRDGKQQIHRVENPLLSGELRVADNDGAVQPLVAELDRLDGRLFSAISASASQQARSGEVTSSSYDPRRLPPLDLSVKELKWDDWRLSRVALRTQPTDSGLKISALTARQDSVRFSGSGYWDYNKAALGGAAAAHNTVLDLNASFDDFGRAIATMGGGESFAEGAGEAALSLTWPKAAYTPDLDAMTGQLLFTLRDGRILTVEPGAGRILGLFALQALPRRLAFDFRDMTNRGLEYSNVSGNLSIGNGQAQTNAIVLTGPVAEILIRGSTDFVVKTYDQTIDVLPRVSGALPLLGVISGGPAAGLTALLADGVLRGIGVNLDEIGRKRFTLTGNWDAPEWRTIKTNNR